VSCPGVRVFFRVFPGRLYVRCVDPRIALEHVLGLAARLNRESPFEGGAGELCGKLALLSAARGLALFAVDMGAAEAELLGAYGIGLEYVRRFPPRERRALAQLPGDLREALRRLETVTVQGIADDPRTLSLTSVARQGMFDVTVAIPVLLERNVQGVLHAFYGGTPPAVPLDLLVRVAPLLADAIGRERLRVALAGAGRGTDPGDEPLGLYSRTQIERLLRHAHAAADRYEGQYSVIVYAVDHPDRLTMRYGTALVEQAVSQLAACVAEESRGSDQAGRLGEASVLVVMPQTLERGAFSQCERTLVRFGRRVFRHGDARLQLSASAGVSCFPENGALDPQATVRSAEVAMQAAIGETGQRIIAIAARGAAAPGA
jgi:diguanylate cyclase (GGDEF)-like protein